MEREKSVILTDRADTLCGKRLPCSSDLEKSFYPMGGERPGGAHQRAFNPVRGAIVTFGTFMTLTLLSVGQAGPPGEIPPVLPGTLPLEEEGDLALRMNDGIHTFLDSYLTVTRERRLRLWEQIFELVEGLPGQRRQQVLDSLEELRLRLRQICGVRDNLESSPELRIWAAVDEVPQLAQCGDVDVYEVFWPAFDAVCGEGLLLVPREVSPIADVVAIPDADQTPEEICGLHPGRSSSRPWALELARGGCRVLVPAVISRTIRSLYRVKLTQREYIYRPAYELGRHVLGYEVQKILAGLEGLRRSDPPAGTQAPGASGERPLALAGWGEGGLLALLTAAICGGEGFAWPEGRPHPGLPSTTWSLAERRPPPTPDRHLRLKAVVVGGFFGPREVMWQEPIDRNIFGFLKHFGGAELVVLSAPASVIVDMTPGPEVTVPPGLGGSPGRLTSADPHSVRAEFAYAEVLLGKLRRFAPESARPILVDEVRGVEAGISPQAVTAFLRQLRGREEEVQPTPVLPVYFRDPRPADREGRQLAQLERHTMWLLEESHFVRRQRLPFTDTFSAKRVELGDYARAMERERVFFYHDVIGKIDWPIEELQVRTRLWRKAPAWIGYEVLIDVFRPGVFAYGILLIPAHLQPGERRPVVVCQHGLEGRPQETIEGDHRAYHDFAARLAERGFVVFAPQNPYIFQDKFRLLQRILNPVGCSLFSVIIPQHAQILAWLKSLSFVDGSRIAFYGLSYGGKTAMRVPAVLTDYCLSICSADFNEWVWKNSAINTRGFYSYVFTGEYEIFEFDLGSTFNYAEMAALIAPRPFMVERGHLDGVAPDETVAYEFAKVRYLYSVVLGMPERCQIEWFVGPHTIHGKGTFEFLHRFLNWPAQGAGDDSL